MKPRLSLGVCVIISLALVLFGLGYGTYAGFADDRQQVADLLAGDNGLTAVLEYRGADGLNLCVVAERHLAGDAAVEALRQLSTVLNDGSRSLAQRREADAGLNEAISAVKQKLNQVQSFTRSERDQRYITLLENDLQSLSRSAVSDAYNTAAKDFNEKLSDSLMGKLAALLGVQPCELYAE